MHRRLLEQPWPMRDCAAFGIVRTIIKPPYAGMRNRSGTHRAWFERNPKVAVDQSVVTEISGCFPNGDNFGVRGGIVISDRAIGSPTDDCTILDDYRAHGHFADIGCCTREVERFLHHFPGF